MNKGKYSVRVTGHGTTHNHPLGEGYKFTYAEKRRITDPAVRSIAEQLHVVEFRCPMCGETSASSCSRRMDGQAHMWRKEEKDYLEPV